MSIRLGALRISRDKSFGISTVLVITQIICPNGSKVDTLHNNDHELVIFNTLGKRLFISSHYAVLCAHVFKSDSFK